MSALAVLVIAIAGALPTRMGHQVPAGARVSAFQVCTLVDSPARVRGRALAGPVSPSTGASYRSRLFRLLDPSFPTPPPPFPVRHPSAALGTWLGAPQPRSAVSMLSSNDFKIGLTIESEGTVFKVVEFLHVKPGKGAAFVRSKLKNLMTGNTVEKTWRAGESVQAAEVEKFDVQFTYKDGDQYVFMDMTSFEELMVDGKAIDQIDFLKESCPATIAKWNGKTISVDLPTQMTLKVTETMPGVKGNTVQGGSKPATLETGAVVQVPLFIEEGEEIRVDTLDKKYISRAKE
jgi:translation elongation factor P